MNRLCDWCPHTGGSLVVTAPAAKHALLAACINCEPEEGISEYYLCDFHFDYYNLHQQTTCYTCRVTLETLHGRLA